MLHAGCAKSNRNTSTTQLNYCIKMQFKAHASKGVCPMTHWWLCSRDAGISNQGHLVCFLQDSTLTVSIVAGPDDARVHA